MKKLLLLPFFVLGAVAVQAQAPASSAAVTSNPTGPQLKFEHLEYNFGNIKQGESVTHEFVFKNTGKEPLIISSASGSCGCTVPSWPKDPIKPGGSEKIKVTFNSAGKLNQQDKHVTILSNAVEGNITLHMKGNVEPKADAAPVTTGGAAAPAPAPGSKVAPAVVPTDKGAAKPVPATAPAREKAAPVPSTKGGGN
jgi:hypothetical protein